MTTRRTKAYTVGDRVMVDYDGADEYERDGVGVVAKVLPDGLLLIRWGKHADGTYAPGEIKPATE